MALGGTGGAGGGPAGFKEQNHLSVDPADNLYFADSSHHCPRRIAPNGALPTPDGRATTLIGRNLHAYFAPNTPATFRPLDWPSAAYAPDRSLSVAERHSHRLALHFPRSDDLFPVAQRRSLFPFKIWFAI